MDRFLSIQAFVRVAETQSFAEAARQLGVSSSVITTRVQQLEEFIGAPLFHGTTRNVRLSEVGQAYYQECTELIHRATDLVDHMREMKGAPTGILRIHALPGFMLGYIALPLRRFQETYPEIILDLVVYDLVIDPVKEGFTALCRSSPPHPSCWWSGGCSLCAGFSVLRRVIWSSTASQKPPASFCSTG
jgi:DNA-binding transcriptional LysR family regulator